MSQEYAWKAQAAIHQFDSTSPQAEQNHSQYEQEFRRHALINSGAFGEPLSGFASGLPGPRLGHRILKQAKSIRTIAYLVTTLNVPYITP